MAKTKEEKRLYDIEYRKKNAEKRKAQKSEWNKRTYDPAVAAEKRKATMPRHVEYCRQPEYRAKKREYDQERQAKPYGEFADAYKLLKELQREICARATHFERYRENQIKQWKPKLKN